MSVTRRILVSPTVRELVHRERIDWHDHDVHQLAYPIRGILQVSTGRGTWVVPPNRAVWIPAGVAHAHQAHGPTEMRSLIFDVGVNPLAVDQPTVLTVGPLLREVIRALSGGENLLASHQYHLEQVALHELRAVRALPLCLPTPTDPRLLALCNLLAADPADPRTLRELGREVGAADRTLSRLFREQTGISFPQWRGQLRLHHAIALLAGGLPVTRVAADCGYRSPSAFIEAFRAAFGTTPGRYMSSGSDGTALPSPGRRLSSGSDGTALPSPGRRLSSGSDGTALPSPGRRLSSGSDGTALPSPGRRLSSGEDGGDEG